MRPGAFHLSFAAALALILAAPANPASAAPQARGAGAAGAGHVFHMAHRGGLRARIGQGRVLGPRLPAFRHGAGRFDRRDRFGHGYGGLLGLPIGYGYGAWDDGYAGYNEEPEPAPKPEWPTRVGIPPSPVAPPAIYVIGGGRKAAAAPRKRSAASAPAAGGSAQVASAPRFIPVPSGR
jgi:hypothetical protein